MTDTTLIARDSIATLQPTPTTAYAGSNTTGEAACRCQGRVLCRCTERALKASARVEGFVWAGLAVCGGASVLYAAIQFVRSL